MYALLCIEDGWYKNAGTSDRPSFIQPISGFITLKRRPETLIV